MIMYLKRLKSSKFVRVKAFPMYGGIGVSAPSLHRASTDSLIISSLIQQRQLSFLHSLSRLPEVSLSLSAGPGSGEEIILLPNERLTPVGNWLP